MDNSVKHNVEVRKESKNKELIVEVDYLDSWLDKITYSENVMTDLNRVLDLSMVSIGMYEIPEHHFRRIWIGDTETYGRIHDEGGFQTKSSSTRKQVLIDKQETVTIDMCALHPRILYTLEGIELPDDFDPYPQLDIQLDTRRINKFKKFYSKDEYDPLRNLSKIVLLILLNAASRSEAVYAIKNKLLADGNKGNTRKEKDMLFIGVPEDLDVSSVIDAVEKHNKDISKYFSKGMSGMLMTKDSDIMIEAIASLVSVDIVCLPVHDSLTVKAVHASHARKALECGYKKVMGSLMNFKCKEE